MCYSYEKAISCKGEKKKQLCEYYRLLYVALTRAQDELYIGGVQPARKVDEKSWYPLICKAVEGIKNHKENKISDKPNTCLEEYGIPKKV